MLDDRNDDAIEIPIIIIDRGWTIDDIKTIQDCDDAFAFLTAAVLSIEEKIEAAKARGTKNPNARKLSYALRWKRAALQAVQNRRGEINREAIRQNNLRMERRILDILKDKVPDAFFAAVKQAQNDLTRPSSNG